MKRFTAKFLGIRLLTLAILITGVMTLSLFASSWATPSQSAQAQTIGEPPSTPERAEDGGAQLVVNPGNSPDEETVEDQSPSPAEVPEENGDTTTDTTVPSVPDNSTDPDTVTYTENDTEVNIQDDGQVRVTLPDNRTLLLGALHDLTIQDLMMLPITVAERQAILNAQYQYALRQTTTSALFFSQKMHPQTVFSMPPAEVDALPVTEQEHQVIKATQFQYSFLKMRMFFTRFLLFQ